MKVRRIAQASFISNIYNRIELNDSISRRVRLIRSTGQNIYGMSHE